jgi:transcription elongation factor GreA
MDKEISYLTKEKQKELEEELKHLKGAKRKEILANLQYAKSLGDLSENAEYHQTREDQAELENQIKRIERILSSVEVISGGGTDIVEVGSSVLVSKVGNKEEKNFQIVGSEEANMSKGKISNKSPFGEALLGKKKNDIVTFISPNGEIKYKIINVY